jgi:quinol monooxygenase YgiN
MLIVTGHVHVDPKDVIDFSSDLKILAARSRRREGNLSYEVATDDPKNGRLLVVERWKDQAALTAHLCAPDTVEFAARWGARITGNVLKYDATRERSLMID